MTADSHSAMPEDGASTHPPLASAPPPLTVRPRRFRYGVPMLLLEAMFVFISVELTLRLFNAFSIADVIAMVGAIFVLGIILQAIAIYVLNPTTEIRLEQQRGFSLQTRHGYVESSWRNISNFTSKDRKERIVCITFRDLDQVEIDQSSVPLFSRTALYIVMLVATSIPLCIVLGRFRLVGSYRFLFDTRAMMKANLRNLNCHLQIIASAYNASGSTMITRAQAMMQHADNQTPNSPPFAIVPAQITDAANR